RVQELLAELYAEPKGTERLTLLHILKRVGVEHATKAFPLIASDFAAARPTHPNDMSFAGFYVVEHFMHLAWKKVPAEEREKKKEPVQYTDAEKKPRPEARERSP